MTLVFAHIVATRNTGDLVSGPYRYLDFPPHRVVDYGAPLPACGAVVYGGGALAGWLRNRPPIAGARRIVWGAGSTRRGTEAPWPDPLGYDLVGIRDWSADREAAGRYVPCVSCLSPVLDTDRPVEREAVLFVNADLTKPRPPVALPVLDNTAPLAEIAAFLASAAVVVTNSYHGAYWATLLGRRVVCVPYSSKFHGFKFPPALSADGVDWRDRAKEARAYPEALEDCRRLNRAFHRRVMDIVA